MYQNANFSRRFFASIFDFLLVLLICFLCFYLTSIRFLALNKNFNDFVIYLPFILCLVFIWQYYFIVPIITEGYTLFFIIFKIKIINQETKKFSALALTLRNIFGVFYWSILIVLFLIFLKPSDLLIQNKKLFFVDNENTKLIQSLFKYLSGLWGMLTSFNFLFILFSKKKLSLFDLMSKSRVVINKKIIPITEEKIIFKPKVYIYRKYIYFSDLQL
ncbi:RDD family protein [Mycoplasmopsis synoviae]|uniref:RDD family protein n=1 Tax=Mycoplasmopsis synoviae TaxID=2109 RepID=UPI000365CF6C|nr:RDD family protein [Mycoplasmopsis synoviae]AKB11270.1 hypothetical protein VY93_02960 [Mycoplasmopsis synoviae ATCC 25204]